MVTVLCGISKQISGAQTMSFPQAHILYLHGFLSSPMSAKAQEMRQYVAHHFPHIQLHMPMLSGIPSKAVEQATTRFSALQHAYGEQLLGVVGSSMGGFLATHLVETVSAPEYAPKAVLINPAVAPHRLFHEYLGAHVNPYTQEQFTLTHADIDVLEQRYIDHIQAPEQFQVWLQTADEVLDYRLAETLYHASDLHIRDGGDHAYQDFSRELPAVCQFLGCERFAQ